MIDRRTALTFGCAQCALLAGGGGAGPGRRVAGATALRAAGARHRRRGGLWALMDREESACAAAPSGSATRSSTTICRALPAGSARSTARTSASMRCAPWFNASMAPNGMMQVWSGLLLRVDNEAQLRLGGRPRDRSLPAAPHGGEAARCAVALGLRHGAQHRPGRSRRDCPARAAGGAAGL